MPNRSLITLTTDFGEADYYVGAMKGVILSIHPEANVVDLSHQIKSHDVFDGAFFISQVFRHFPPQTVHCVVVDPGVGTSRRPLIVHAHNSYFVGPDNGVFSLIYEQSESVVVHATATHYFRGEISQTFHGRDIFAPVAAWLTRGIQLSHFGETVTDYVKFKLPKARVEAPNRVQGAIIKIDRFGNCVTNITPDLLPDFFAPQRPPFKFRIGTNYIHQICAAYAEADSHEPFIILGSSDYLEVGVNRGSAADYLKVTRGSEVEVTW